MAYRILIFDDSCALAHSDDTGDTFAIMATPTNSLGDTWTDMVMAINDGDYKTVGVFDVAVNSSQDPSHFDGNRGGFQQANIDAQDLAALPVADYSYGTVGVNYQQAISGAISTGNALSLVLPYHADNVLNSYPRKSVDGGATWANLTALGNNKQWTRACFSKNAGVMYVHSASAHVQKSVDGGATWPALSASPQFNSGSPLPGSGENTLRMRCSQDGTIVAMLDYQGQFWISRDSGTTWAHTDIAALTGGSTLIADFGMSLDGQTILVGVTNNANTRSWIYRSTNAGVSFGALTLPLNVTTPLLSVNVAPDGLGMVVAYYVFDPSKIDVSTDGGASWTTKSLTTPDTGGVWVSAYIMPPPTAPTPSDEPDIDPLIGATYRRVSAITAEAPAFVGWHRHDFGHRRNDLTSIGVSADIGGLLDHLDMVSTDGTNYMVEGFTQIFDEDDHLSDGWFLDGALVPDSAYEDTVSGVTGVRFTGLRWLGVGSVVTVCAFGLDLGDYAVDSNGTVFVPYGSGVAPAAWDYTVAGAGAYLFTAAFIAANLSSTDVRNGGVPYSGKFMPAVVGYTYTSDGQALRPTAPEQSGTRAGPSFGSKKRSHYVKALLKNTIGVSFGTDFGSTLQAAKLSDDAGNQNDPQSPYTGLWKETLNDDYSFDSMLSWRITRPYPASVVSIGASIEGQDS